MQTRGTFPALSAGEKKTRRNSGTYARRDRGFANFAASSRPRRVKEPLSLAGRRAAAHRKARG